MFSSTMEDKSLNPIENADEGNLWIKLDIPKTEESDVIEVKPDDQLRVCGICNREFSSGKALGGHMRVHVQDLRTDLPKASKNSVRIVKRNSIEKSQHLDSLSEKPNCPTCGKGFRSMKSLFGHMRCHPERDYRGICPPQTGLNHFSSCSSVSDEMGEETAALPTWSTKAKRGKRSFISVDDSSSEEDEYVLTEADKEAVYELMSLAYGESFLPDFDFSSLGHKVKASHSNSLAIGADVGCKSRVFESKKRRIGDLGYGCGSKSKQLRINETVKFEVKDKRKVLFGCDENAFSDYEFERKDLDGSESSDDLITRMRSKKQRIVMKNPKIRDIRSVENDMGYKNGEDIVNVVEKGPLVKYKCSTCNKCFPSHQALGGHRSSHTKPRYAKQTLDIELALADKGDDSPNASQGDEAKDSNTIECVEPLNSVAAHECTICHKSFNTGQALGGHMRCHYSGPGQTEGPSSSNAMSSPCPMGPASSHVMSSPGEEASRTRVLGLDLNVAPSEEDDGGVESQNVAGILQFGDDFSSQ